jgi:hypothetical protein
LRLRYAYASNMLANGSRAFFTTSCTICEPTRTSRDDPHAGGGGLLRRAQHSLLFTGAAHQTQADAVHQAVEVTAPSH